MILNVDHLVKLFVFILFIYDLHVFKFNADFIFGNLTLFISKAAALGGRFIDLHEVIAEFGSN